MQSGDESLRLECLRLAARPGLDPAEIIALANQYLSWCQGSNAPTTRSGGPAKQQGATRPR